MPAEQWLLPFAQRGSGELRIRSALAVQAPADDSVSTRPPEDGTIGRSSAQLAAAAASLVSTAACRSSSLLVAVEGIAVGQLAGVEVADMRPVGVLPDQHSQRQLDADAGVGLHQGGADARVAEDQQDVGFQLDIGLAGAGRMVDAREQLQAMRVERLAQPRLDLIGITAGGQLDHVEARWVAGSSRTPSSQLLIAAATSGQSGATMCRCGRPSNSR